MNEIEFTMLADETYESLGIEPPPVLRAKPTVPAVPAAIVIVGSAIVALGTAFLLTQTFGSHTNVRMGVIYPSIPE